MSSAGVGLFNNTSLVGILSDLSVAQSTERKQQKKIKAPMSKRHQ